MGKIQDEECDGITPLGETVDKSWMYTKSPIGDVGQIVSAAQVLGMKFDDNKRDFTLLPWPAVEEIVKVLEFGAKKYARDNWKNVEADRYTKAAFRHLIAYSQGEENDKESGLSHLAHLGCCVLFLLALGEKK
jgi:hypothetical protein